jgi:transcription antitermination factor NusG
VRAKAGTRFGGFAGQVVDVNGRGAVNVLIEIFGRLTPVEFPAADVDIVDPEAIASAQG